MCALRTFPSRHAGSEVGKFYECAPCIYIRTIKQILSLVIAFYFSWTFGRLFAESLGLRERFFFFIPIRKLRYDPARDAAVRGPEWRGEAGREGWRVYAILLSREAAAAAVCARETGARANRSNYATRLGRITRVGKYTRGRLVRTYTPYRLVRLRRKTRWKTKNKNGAKKNGPRRADTVRANFFTSGYYNIVTFFYSAREVYMFNKAQPVCYTRRRDRPSRPGKSATNFSTKPRNLRSKIVVVFFSLLKEVSVLRIFRAKPSGSLCIYIYMEILPHLYFFISSAGTIWRRVFRASEGTKYIILSYRDDDADRAIHTAVPTRNSRYCNFICMSSRCN